MAADKNISTLIGGRKKSRQSKKKTQRKPKTKKIRRIGITVGSDNGEKHPYFKKNKEKYSILDRMFFFPTPVLIRPISKFLFRKNGKLVDGYRSNSKY